MSTRGPRDCSMIEVVQREESAAYLKPAFAPKMMSVSKFLEPFDETSLTDEAAAQKYSTYVAVFLKDQIQEQFEHNKVYAWFRDKYHPDCMVSKEKDRQLILNRFETFKKLLNEGYINNVSLEYKERLAVTKLLDQCNYIILILCILPGLK